MKNFALQLNSFEFIKVLVPHENTLHATTFCFQPNEKTFEDSESSQFWYNDFSNMATHYVNFGLL